MTTVKGTFEVTVQGEPPFDVEGGVTLARTTVEKRFAGPLEGTSNVYMLGARTPVEGSAAYVAMERVTGTLEGRRGTFLLRHVGAMGGGARSLDVAVVADSGTGELAGLTGRMEIDIVSGKHLYTFEYALTETAG